MTKRKQSILIGSGLIPDGYNGDFKNVDFLFHVPSGKTLVDWEGGVFTYHTPVADDKREAVWLIEHHPASNVKFFTQA